MKTLDDYFERYDAFLLDAYGVLVDGSGILPGAARFLAEVQSNRPFCIVTNDASRLPSTIVTKWQEFGLSVEENHIVTSGVVLQSYLSRHHQGKSAVVLGTPDARTYVERAGCALVDPSEPFDIFVLADELGFDFLPTCNAALSGLIKQLRTGHLVHVLLPNPDVIYPAGPGRFGFAAAGVAAMFETALRQLFGAEAPEFLRLGKPHAAIFEEAARRVGATAPVVVGDQLTTDIAGAHAAGFDSVLYHSGVPPARSTTIAPTCLWSEFPIRR